jgi:beta propeller repeat protein
MVATIPVISDREGWVYFRLTDPKQAKFPIESVLRSDGKQLNPNNYWTHIRFRREDNRKLTYLNVFDFVTLGNYEYTVTYGQIAPDGEPPVTRIRFTGAMQESGGHYYILPETQIYFTVEDASPVGTWYRLDDDVPFLPALPFSIAAGGAHTVHFYSQDTAGNTEAEQAVTVIVASDYPEVVNFTSDQDEMFYAGDALSVQPTRLAFNFEGATAGSRLDALVDIFKGVAAWVTLSGVPSTPTVDTNAIIEVGGEFVDFYRYRLGGGAWSSEFPAGASITLSGLANGTVDLYVKGRSQYGDYMPDEQSTHVFWVVDPEAPLVTLRGPTTPTRSPDAEITVATEGDDYCYRVDQSYYQPSPGPNLTVQLDGLEQGAHMLEAIAIADGEICPADEPGTACHWLVDYHYGFDFSNLDFVRQFFFADIAGISTDFEWDGTDEEGAVVAPGWYTIRLTVADDLGRSTAAVKLVHVGDLMADSRGTAGGVVYQINPHAWGRWAVWQEQHNDNWDIYALEIADSNSLPQAITTNPLNQERPKTDGRYVVWEDRQPDGGWDIWGQALGSADDSFAVTSTPDRDERKPAIYWPWVVYQARPANDPSAPWQLVVANLLAGTSENVDPTDQDQLDAAIYKNRIVWQDFRDPGYGEIYLKDLNTGTVTRITDDVDGQYHPSIFGQWIVWADKRHTQSELYGFNLLRGIQIRLTDTPENETQPAANGKWVVYREDAAGVQSNNVRALYLPTLAAVQLTNFTSDKLKPVMSSGSLVWQDNRSGTSQVMLGVLPNLQPVFNNQNAVVITPGMVAHQQDAFTLLRLWHSQAGVASVTRYTQLLPAPIPETVSWDTEPVGPNFNLTAGEFLWVRFGQAQILNLGQDACSPVDLVPGVNVLSYWCFPDHYRAYKLVAEIGMDKINAVRLLDSDSGQWRVAAISGGMIVGDDFEIPPIGMLLLDMQSALNSWVPGE